MSDDRVSTVMSIYEAFGRGDVATILGHLADDVRWDHGIRRTSVPYLREVTGHAAVADFFRALDEQLEVSKFEISTAVASDREVFTRVHLAGRNKHTGIEVPEAPEAHHFVFDADGKVASFTHIGDWAVHEAAMPGGRPLEIAHATA
jgi:ketosteroid isomerase-like protein